MRRTAGRRRATGLLLALAGAMFFTTQPASTRANQSYSSIIFIETEEVEDYMTFEGSQLIPIIKATVSWRQGEGQTPAENAPEGEYEELWYKGGEPLGLEIHGGLGKRELALTQVRISSKSKHPSSAEMAAQANALVQVYLASYLRFALLTSVLVPDETFDSLVTCLGRENFFASQAVYGSGLDPSILLPLESQNGKSSANLYFSKVR